MDPSQTELDDMDNLRKVVDWIGLRGGDMIDENTITGSLCSLLGATEDTKPAVIGSVPEADYVHTLAAWKINVLAADGTVSSIRAPTLTEVGHARMLGHVCRLVAGSGVTVESLKAQLAAASTSQATPPTAAPSPGRRFKLSSVTSQGDDSEVSIADQKILQACYQRYQTVYGKGELPPKDTEPTTEQVSAVLHLLSEGVPPYVDFAIFSPFQQRMQKKLKLTGLNIGRDGVLRNVELLGPPNISMWLGSYNVLMNTLVMVDAVDLGILLKYRNHIERLHDRYSDKVWTVLYQSDVRCRLELMERIRRTLQAEYDAGQAPDFDPKRPWNAVWQRAVQDETFWREEVMEPSLLILTKVAGLNELVAGDATTGSNSGAHASPAHPREDTPAPARLSQPASSHQPFRTRNNSRTGRFHHVEGGKYTTNRTGYPLCAGYNSGECTQTSQGQWCPHKWDTVHQCDRCLGSHPSVRCPHTEMPTPAFVKGKGKNAGKGRGKKGRGKGRPQY